MTSLLVSLTSSLEVNFFGHVSHGSYETLLLGRPARRKRHGCLVTRWIGNERQRIDVHWISFCKMFSELREAISCSVDRAPSAYNVRRVFTS